MRGEEKKHFVAACRKRYGEKHGRKAKSDLLDDLMQYVGYKSRKHAFRVLNRTPGKRKLKPRGRRRILTPLMLGLLREIWALQGYPCSKLLKASLPDWIEARTPYQRLMEHLPEGRRKERLKAFHESLDPIDLTLKVQQCRAAILHLLQQHKIAQ